MAQSRNRGARFVHAPVRGKPNPPETMRITYLSNSIIPSRTANSINVMKMCAAFASLGHEVQLVTPDREPKQAAADVHEFYGVPNSFEIRVLPWHRVKGRSYIYAINAARQAKRCGTDIAYTRSSFCALSAVAQGLDVILELHAAPRGVQKRQIELVSRSSRLHRVVCISAALARHVKSQFPSLAERTMVAHDGADQQRRPKAEQHNSRDASFRAGYVGHLYPGKGMELISELVRHCPEVSFHVVGGMPEDIDYWKKELAGIENLTLHGFVPPGEVQDYLATFDILLAPYGSAVSGYGGKSNIVKWMSPLKLFEYMAAGKAIVCTDLESLREVLVHEETGLLCGANDVEDWSAAVKRLASDPELRERLGRAARDLFEDRYTWKARAKNIIRNAQPRGHWSVVAD